MSIDSGTFRDRTTTLNFQLFQDLVHLAEFAPDVALGVMVAVYLYDGSRVNLVNRIDVTNILRIKKEDLAKIAEDCAKAGQDLLDLNKKLRNLPELAP